MNGSSFALFRNFPVLLLSCGIVCVVAIPSISVVAVTSISVGGIVNGDAITEIDWSRSECDKTDAPINFMAGESEVSKPTAMLQYEAMHSPANRIVPPVQIANFVTKQNSSFDIEGGVAGLFNGDSSVSEAPVADIQSVLLNMTTKTLALESAVSSAVSASRTHASINETHDTRSHASVNDSRESKSHARTRRKRYKKREVSYWDKLPIFFALASIPLLCLVVRSRSGSSKSDSDNDIGDYWDAQRSVGLDAQ